MNKYIAILTHFHVCNFGANMQALSTYSYLQNHGWNPIMIDWASYQQKLFSNVSQEQQKAHDDFVKTHFKMTPPLNDEDEIISYLEKNEIYNVIVGSDAVFGIETFLERWRLDKKGFHHRKSSPDKLFPNTFWLSKLVTKNKFKVAMMSVSSQNAAYQLFSSTIRQDMKKCLQRYDYISVRDKWTQQMIKKVSERWVPVTPDPVWAFGVNVLDKETKEKFLKRMEITSPYILLGFQNAYPESTKAWLDDFVPLAKKNGYTCIPLPFAFGYFNYPYDKQISLPLSPMDWYRLIKYSSGYVGYNMHPVIASMSNNIPCFSIDNYGITIAKVYNIEQSSKIYDIFLQSNRLDYRCNIRKFFKGHALSPADIMQRLLDYNYESGAKFADAQRETYNHMMIQITNLFKQN